MEPWQQIGSVLGCVALVGGFLYWHFKVVHGLKDSIKELELKMKDLERTDALQQQTLDQLNALFPTLHEAMKVIADKKKR